MDADNYDKIDKQVNPFVFIGVIFAAIAILFFYIDPIRDRLNVFEKSMVIMHSYADYQQFENSIDDDESISVVFFGTSQTRSILYYAPDFLHYSNDSLSLPLHTLKMTMATGRLPYFNRTIKTFIRKKPDFICIEDDLLLLDEVVGGKPNRLTKIEWLKAMFPRFVKRALKRKFDVFTYPHDNDNGLYNISDDDLKAMEEKYKRRYERRHDYDDMIEHYISKMEYRSFNPDTTLQMACSIFEYAKNRGVRIIVYRPPIAKELQADKVIMEYDSITDAKIQQLQLQYDFTFLDASKEYSHNFFTDFSHANHRLVPIYSQWFGREIERLY